jgi:hypothetical protein
MSTEAVVTSHIKLLAAQSGVDLWRNNSGGFYDENGRFVRYGLGSFTEQQALASSDYIGIRPVLITQEMVGSMLGVFTAVEMKKPNWRPDKRSVHQQNFIDLVNSRGGFAGFAENVEQFKRIIRHV